MATNGYRAKKKKKKKEDSVCFWHMFTLSQRCDYSQKWPVQSVCKVLTSGFAIGITGAAARLERACYLRSYIV